MEPPWHMSLRWIAASLRAHLSQVLLIASAGGLMVLITYTLLATPLPVYILDKLNLRPFFLPNIICDRCNNFTYTYMINNSEACRDRDVYLLIIVASFHANADGRKAIRQTWGGNQMYRGYKIKTLFFFGTHTDNNFHKLLQHEQQKYGDIVQANFEDHYRFLTNKTMMSLKWVTQFCPQAKYVLKTDDDAFNVPQRFVDYLVHVEMQRFIGGYCFTIMPDRWDGSKFYVPYSLYPDKYYPTYCSGPGYVLSNAAVRDIVNIAVNVSFLPSEDVFVSGMVRVAAHIQYTQIEGIVINKDLMTKCALATWAKNTHNIVPEQQIMIWEERVVMADKDVDCAGRNGVILVMVLLFLAF